MRNSIKNSEWKTANFDGSFRLSARLNKLLVSFNELPVTFNELAEIGRNWLRLAEIARHWPKLAEIGEKLGTIGNEFGTVTSRKRRCGWFDGVLVRQTIKISGINGIALTKLDVLDKFDEIKMCIAYEVDGKKNRLFTSICRRANKS